MAKIPNEVIDQVRNAVDIADVIGQDVQLRRQGKNLMGHCPFHRDDTPSFAVNEEKQFFYCFSCHRTGNVFGFLQQYHQLSFPEAVAKVADMAGMTLPEQYINDATATSPNQNSETGSLYQLHQAAAALYHHLLVNTPAGQAALHYLHQRGTNDEMIEEFQLGFAPDSEEEVLLEYCQQQKLDYQLLRKSGLFIADNQGNLHDRFRGRVMYPLTNGNGQVVAFSGRILVKKGTDRIPKYLNSPETEIFNKRDNLFNLHRAKRAVREEGHLILFEGFMDVISAYGAGVHSGVASMGTSLTDDQVQIMQRFSKQLLVCYDGDEAGQNAISRALDLIAADAPDLAVQIVQLPDGQDPDEYVQRFGADKFRNYLANAVETPTQFKLSYLRQGLNLQNQQELIGYLNAALRIIGQLSEPVARNVYLKNLADEFNLSENNLQEQLRQILPSLQRQSKRRDNNHADNWRSPNEGQLSDSETTSLQVAGGGKVENAEQRLLRYYLSSSGIRQQINHASGFQFADEAYQRVFTQLKELTRGQDEVSLSALLDQLENDADRSLLAGVANIAVDEETAQEVVNDCIAVIMHEAPIKQQIQAQKAAMKQASLMGDDDAATKIATELVKLLQKQQDMKTEEIG